MQEYKTVKNSLINPMRDKRRLMKVEHLLSNNYVLAGILLAIDLFLFAGMNYIRHLFTSIPAFILQKITMKELFSVRYVFPESFELSTLCIFLLVVLILDAVLAFRIKISWSEEYFNVGQEGTERFVTEEEIKEEYKAVEIVETVNGEPRLILQEGETGRYPGNPGTLIARIGNVFYIDDTVVNNLYLGITRSGKGELFVKTNMELYSRAQNQPSIIINDPKLEHYKVFRPVLEKRGYKVFLLNAANPEMSMGFNPIDLVVRYYRENDYDTAEMVANSIAHSYFNVDKARGDMIFFTSSASSLFVAMVLAAVDDAITADKIENQKRYEGWIRMPVEQRREHPFRYRNDNEKTASLYSMVINFGQMVTKPVTKDGTRTMLDVYFEKRQPFDRARLKYLGVEVAPGKTKSGVFAEMLRELSIFTLHNVAKMTAESTLDFAEIGFGKQPVAVFLATPSYDSSLYKLPTIFIRQMYYVLGKMCDDGKGKCDRQVKVVEDEAGNMPEIELMKVMTTMGLGQNISFDLYLQNYEQLEELYGKQIAETIKGNCGNHIYLQTQSTDTALEFSKKLGNKSIIDVQRAGGKLSWNKYFTESIKKRPLLDENELMDLMEGECVIKRISKRKDMEGRKIKPRPIFNSVENGHYLWYTYEYFPKEEYPNPNTVDFRKVCRESRKHIEPRERLWDLEKSWKILEGKTGKIKTLKDVGYQQILSRLESCSEKPEGWESFSEEMSVAQAAAWILEMPLTGEEKEELLEELNERKAV